MWWRRDLVASYVVKNAPAEKGKRGELSVSKGSLLEGKRKKNTEDWEEYTRG